MIHRKLGRSGLRVSRLALGCMSYGAPTWRNWILPESESMPFFRRAIEGGINLFDTADMYSLGESERITGKALRELARRDEVVIATKVFFPISEGPNGRGLSRKHIVEACEASLKRLGVDYIDLYQLHRFDPETPIDETLAALEQLVQQGKVLYLGASSGPAWQLARMLGLQDRNGFSRFVSMQNHYNLVYREEEREMIPLCEAEGVGCLPWSPLARGLLAGKRTGLDDRASTTRAGSDVHAHHLYDHPNDWDVVVATQSVAARRGVSPAQIALAWLLSKPGVVAPIVGATQLAHLDDALAALKLTLSAEELAELEGPYRPHAIKW